MTRYDISHWTIDDSNGKKGLLLFSQALEELLAIHSHDSHKVPVLNFHFICHEIIQVLALIEDNVLDRGNLIPLFAEMKILFQNDSIAQEILGKDITNLFACKNSKGEYDRNPLKIDSAKDVDAAIPVIKRGTRFVIDELERKDQYYKKLTQDIKQRVSECGNDLLKMDEIYNRTRIFASELINRGFNQSYIYDCIIQVFFDPGKSVSSLETIDEFFKCFSSSDNKYCIYLPLNSLKQKQALDDYGIFKTAENVYEMFDPTVPYVLKFECDSTDPYQAREVTLTLINFCLSINQFIKHNKYDYNPKYAEIVDKEKQSVTFIRKPVPPISRENTNSEELQVNDLLESCSGLGAGVFQVLQLHSSAMISKNTDNQIINLWTAIEVVIPVARKDSLSRINQISNVLTAGLGCNYFSTLSQQLFLDIKSVDESASSQIERISIEGKQSDKMLAVLILPKYQSTYDIVLDTITDSSPLLACRMYRYKSLWSTTQSIKKVYESHEKRLAQQIMRIYRTRNMLVHDGTTLVYADYVLQNLHYYVDSFIRFLYKYFNLGYNSISTIIDAVLFQECTYLQSLSENVTLDELNFSKYIR